jgi:hypothetical protein
MLRTYRERKDPYRNCVIDVSEESAASIIKVEESDEMERMVQAEKQEGLLPGFVRTLTHMYGKHGC